MDTQIILTSLAGGLLIGLAATLLLLGTGRIAGISGIFGSVVSGRRDTIALVFLIAFLVSPWVAHLIGLSLPDLPRTSGNWPKLIAAGLLVGVGTQVGSGCTSGHGVCGISNLSPRSITATIVFMLVAGVVVGFGFGGVL
jgi:hypothetical protein